MYVGIQASPHRIATAFLFLVLSFVVGLGVLLLLLLSMFAATVGTHWIELCLVVLQSLITETAYRLMLTGLVCILSAAALFAGQVVRATRRTNAQIHTLLSAPRVGQGSPDEIRVTRVASRFAQSHAIDLIREDAPLAFCYGWLKRRILITTAFVELLDDEELTAVLTHEIYHLKQCDPLKILLVRSIRDSLFFLPILQDLVQNYLALQEIAADQFAIRSHAQRSALANALIKILQVPASDALSVSAFSPMEVRIQHLANPDRRFRIQFSSLRLLLSVVCGTALVGMVFHPSVPMLLEHNLLAHCDDHSFRVIAESIHRWAA